MKLSKCFTILSSNFVEVFSETCFGESVLIVGYQWTTPYGIVLVQIS